jgi:hypothetical protein
VDAFEQLAADLLWNEGYWVRTCVKVELTREEKQLIGRPSSPRWEIDLVAYRPATDELLALECKSYLDSGGVHAAHFEPDSRYAHRYKLFHDQLLRQTVLNRLKLQCVERGLCSPETKVRIGLIYAHATKANEIRLIERFTQHGWLLYGPEWLNSGLTRLAGGGYENSLAAVVSKIFGRSLGAPATILRTAENGRAVAARDPGVLGVD